MDNIIREMDYCADFIRATWIAVVRGGFDAPPGSPQLKFDTIQQRNRYADSITAAKNLDVPEIGRFERVIVATDKIGEDTERGMDPWDMKPMLLGGPKARFSKSGHKYNIIPFRHGVPSGNANSHFKQMPKDIYEAAKQLKPTVSKRVNLDLFGNEHYQKVIKYGEKLRGTELAYPPIKKRFPIVQNGVVRFATTQHKNGLYEGMIRVQAEYGKAKQNQYLTFRVVSEKSDPFSWWHPGRAAQAHVQFVVNYCRPQVEARLVEAVKEDLGSLTRTNIGIAVVVDL